MHIDSAARLGVYEAAVDNIVASIQESLGERTRSRMVWVSTKAVYSGLINDRDDWEIAETFFNSVIRRIFDIVGVDEEIEFVHSDYGSPPSPARHPVCQAFDTSCSLTRCIRLLLSAYDLMSEEEQTQQAHAVVSAISEHMQLRHRLCDIERIEVIKSVFYRGEYAYVIGRLVGTRPLRPFVLCFRHTQQGVLIDAVLLDPADVSLLFSFARSYFHVDTERPFDIVQFIKSIIPRKPRSEIYNSIGYKKHGKTELYRHALRHLGGSTDKYLLAKGQRGMVMIVFTMPSYPVVFKIIKDRFDDPKQTTRQAVMDCYRLVFQHDRAGRLIDAQEYQYLTLDRNRFDKELLDELLSVASQTVRIEGDRVVIKHCYAERRVTPLDVYLRQADEQAAMTLPTPGEMRNNRTCQDSLRDTNCMESACNNEAESSSGISASSSKRSVCVNTSSGLPGFTQAPSCAIRSTDIAVEWGRDRTFLQVTLSNSQSRFLYPDLGGNDHDVGFTRQQVIRGNVLIRAKGLSAFQARVRLHFLCLGRGETRLGLLQSQAVIRGIEFEQQVAPLYFPADVRQHSLDDRGHFRGHSGYIERPHLGRGVSFHVHQYFRHWLDRNGNSFPGLNGASQKQAG